MDKMKILFISSDNMMATHIAYKLKTEGHDIKLFIDSKERFSNFNNIIKKTSSWRKELKWLGKNNSLIIFDDVGYGKIQDNLRKQGYSVFGGNELSDRLELDREYANLLFTKVGMKTACLKNFNSINSAIKFVNKNKGAWVIKQNADAPKCLNYVGQSEDGADVVSVLKNYNEIYGDKIGIITLQKKIVGVEIGVGRYFNGNDWVGPIEINLEHKKFFPGDIGPTTSEMGTLAWYDDNENNKIFKETLSKLKNHLKKINFKGDIDIGCIVNADGVFPLEVTPRFGSPIIYLHDEFHISPWGDFLKAISDGKSFELKWNRGYGIVVLLAVPPFPYSYKIKDNSSKGINIFFDKSIDLNTLKHIYFEGVSLKYQKDGKKQYFISDNQGYVFYITSVAKTIEEARLNTLNIIKNIYIPKMFYRHDIGVRFIESDKKKLLEWGYL